MPVNTRNSGAKIAVVLCSKWPEPTRSSPRAPPERSLELIGSLGWSGEILSTYCMTGAYAPPAYHRRILSGSAYSGHAPRLGRCGAGRLDKNGQAVSCTAHAREPTAQPLSRDFRPGWRCRSPRRHYCWSVTKVVLCYRLRPNLRRLQFGAPCSAAGSLLMLVPASSARAAGSDRRTSLSSRGQPMRRPMRLISQ